MALLGQLLLALGIDVRWVITALLLLVVTGLVVVLIVVETVAIALTGGGQADQAASHVSAPTPGSPFALPVPTAAPPVNLDLKARIVEFARTWLGVPYLFGGCSRGGVDCSCLVQNVFAAVGIRLPRVAVDQFNITSAVAGPQPGDLVFFANTYQPGISHVGIYIGNGLQINAPTTGEVVSVAPVFTGYWGAHYAGAHRVPS
jgi:cell wall-associated NlpC family hydrolase